MSDMEQEEYDKLIEKGKKGYSGKCNFMEKDRPDEGVYCNLMQSFGEHPLCDYDNCIFIKILKKLNEKKS